MAKQLHLHAVHSKASKVRLKMTNAALEAYAIDKLESATAFRDMEQAMVEATQGSMRTVVMFWVVRTFRATRGQSQLRQLCAILGSSLIHKKVRLNAFTVVREHTLGQVPLLVQNAQKACSNHPKHSRNV